MEASKDAVFIRLKRVRLKVSFDVSWFCFLLMTQCKEFAFFYAEASGGRRPIAPIEDTFEEHWQNSQRRPASSSEISQGPMSRELRLLTFNLNGVPVPVGYDHSRYQDGGRVLAQMRREQRAPHVVALQEAFHSRTDEFIRESHYPYVVRGPGGSSGKWNSGLAILSEYPIVSTGTIVYSHCVSWDCLANKGAVWVRIQLPDVGESIELVNTHMNAEPSQDFWTPDETTWDIRFSQMQELREMIDERVQGDSLLFSVGDFNFRRQDPDFESYSGFLNLMDAIFFCGSSSQQCSGFQQALQHSSDAIDHQFIRSGVHLKAQPIRYEEILNQEVNGRRLSDHNGIYITYKLDRR